MTENATSQWRCTVDDQKDRGLWERDCTKGTPGDSWRLGYLWYWEHGHSLVSAIFGLILAPRATRLYFYHFIKYLVPQRTLGKQRKDIYFEIKARSKCFEITLIARAYILLRNDLSPPLTKRSLWISALRSIRKLKGVPRANHYDISGLCYNCIPWVYNRNNQELSTTVFCKISVQRCKYCLELSITSGPLKISWWPFPSSMYNFRSLSNKFPTIFWSVIFHLPPRSG